jgi:hypothetical protein
VRVRDSVLQHYSLRLLVTELPLTFSTSLLAFIIGYWMVGFHRRFILHLEHQPVRCSVQEVAVLTRKARGFALA